MGSQDQDRDPGTGEGLTESKPKGGLIEGRTFRGMVDTSPGTAPLPGSRAAGLLLP